MSNPYHIAILGAGFGGLGIAAKLKAEGVTSFVILEKASRIGGTWRDNTYPGCACDVPSHLYWFSFGPQPDWSRMFSPQDEILRNIEAFVDRYELAAHLRLECEVTAAHWDEAAALWSIETASGEQIAARILIGAWGQLNRPKLPEIEGRESFAGSSFHTARWPQDADLSGKRIGCIGNGASAAQIIPEIAPQALHLAVFQRSASWVVPRMDRAYTREERATFQNDPNSQREHRELIYRDMESRYEAMIPGTAKAMEFAAIAMAHLDAQVSDSALRERLRPDYALACKRVIVSDDLYPALGRSNVSLVTEPIHRIEKRGVRTVDGLLHELDVLIHATGFETTSFLGKLDIHGRNGESLREKWRDGAHAYLGMAVSGFPNFFLLYGPNTNLGHNSILAMLECQYTYLLQAIHRIQADRVQTLEVREDVMARYNLDLQEKLRHMAWATGCGSWYKTSTGRITNNWCGSVDEYQARTALFEKNDYREN